MKQVEIIKAKNITNRTFSKELKRLRVAAYCCVSTDSEDQLNSYKSQVQYYTDLINGKRDWILVDIYADEAIGEEDQYCIRDHHDPIISQEVFESAQRIIQRRAKGRKAVEGKREKYSRKYAFSSLLECGFCDSNLSRRSWHSGSNYHKSIWQCITNIKKGKKSVLMQKGLQVKGDGRGRKD